MPAQRNPTAPNRADRPIPSPNRGRVLKEPMLLLLLGQPCKLDIERMIAREKRLLTMQDRRVGDFLCI